MLIGYARVSTVEQTTAAQYEAFQRAGVDRIYEEKRSAVMDRPVLEEVLSSLAAGDVLVVYKMDRLARSLSHLLSVLALLQSRDVGFRSLTEPIETDTAVGRLFLQLLGSFAEFERSLIRERCEAGRLAAKARGVKFGHAPLLLGDNVSLVIDLYQSGFSISEVASLLGMSRSGIQGTLVRHGVARRPMGHKSS
jgi:DNA invertase Pin-like site-specific DNA recombinase